MDDLLFEDVFAAVSTTTPVKLPMVFPCLQCGLELPDVQHLDKHKLEMHSAHSSATDAHNVPDLLQDLHTTAGSPSTSKGWIVTKKTKNSSRTLPDKLAGEEFASEQESGEGVYGEYELQPSTVVSEQLQSSLFDIAVTGDTEQISISDHSPVVRVGQTPAVNIHHDSDMRVELGHGWSPLDQLQISRGLQEINKIQKAGHAIESDMYAPPPPVWHTQQIQGGAAPVQYTMDPQGLYANHNLQYQRLQQMGEYASEQGHMSAGFPSSVHPHHMNAVSYSSHTVAPTHSQTHITTHSQHAASQSHSHHTDAPPRLLTSKATSRQEFIALAAAQQAHQRDGDARHSLKCLMCDFSTSSIVDLAKHRKQCKRKNKKLPD